MKTTGNILVALAAVFALGSLFSAFSLFGELSANQIEFSVFLPRLVGAFLIPAILLIIGLKLKEKK